MISKLAMRPISSVGWAREWVGPASFLECYVDHREIPVGGQDIEPPLFLALEGFLVRKELLLQDNRCTGHPGLPERSYGETYDRNTTRGCPRRNVSGS
jgi:hypothetical protein